MPKPELVALGSGVIGSYQRPEKITEKSEIAIYVMHATQDYVSVFSASKELAERGYTVLTLNNSNSKNGRANDFDLERIVLDISKGINFLREQKDIKEVILFGHSGGGAMMAAYQNIAENGGSSLDGMNKKLYTPSEKIKNLPKADGLILVDANYGLSTMTLFSMNPAIIDENNSKNIREDLNLFSKENGFYETGAKYTKEFAEKYQKSLAERMNKLINFAQERENLINKGEGNFSDDEPLTVVDANYIGFNNKFFSQDTRFLSHTKYPWSLIHKDNSITNEIVHTVRPAKNLNLAVRESYLNGSLKTTVKSFLNTFAISVDENFSFNESEILGVDWSSSYTSPIGAVKGIRVPLLTLGMTGNWEFLAAEKIYLNSSSNDKEIAFVEGASHLIKELEEKYGDTTKLTYDYIDKWIEKKGRFLK